MSGLIILPIFIFYVYIAFLVFKFILKLINKEIKGFILLVIVILLPFWDLILLKTMKEVYLITHSNPLIHEKIKFDKNGKYESLAMFASVDDIDRLKEDIPKYYKNTFDLVNSHIEFLVKNKDTNETKILKVKQISEDKYNFTYLDKSQAQYKLIAEGTSWFFDMAGTRRYKVYNTKKNKLIATNYRIFLSGNKKAIYFREEILLMKSGNGFPLVYVEDSGASSGLGIMSRLRILK